MKKRLISLLLALAMMFSMTATAFAAGPGSITITNATVGKDYSAYKVFDATYSGTAVSYTIKSTDSWYSLVNADTNTPFDLAKVGSSDTYVVSVKTGKTDADVIAWFQAQTPPGSPEATTPSGGATSTTVKFENIPLGYYYIKSTLGTTISLTTTKPSATIIDKNQKPGWDGTPDNGKTVAKTANGTYGKTSTAAIGDTVYYKINAFVPKYDGPKEIGTYTFTDTLDAGLTYNTDMALTLNGTALTSGYSVNVSGQTITVTLTPSSITNYPTDGKLEMKFTAKVNALATCENKNNVNMSWTYKDNSTVPTGNFPATSTTTTYVYGFNLQKVKRGHGGNNGGSGLAQLEGAKFKLYTALTGGTEIKVVKLSDGSYRVATAAEITATPSPIVEIEAGFAKIWGLDIGTYYLEETVTPEGYNPLTARVKVEITATSAGMVNVANPDEEPRYECQLKQTVQVINESGSILPETGGMGTTMLYTLGLVLVLGSGVAFTVRRKRNI